jgi:hypothetical protein
MNKTRAAQIWAQLERFLIERCGLPDGRMLERDRPELIRTIGAELQGTAPAQMLTPRKPPRKPAQTPRKSEQTAQLAQFRLIPANSGNDTIHDVRLAAMLERSCSRRMGYDGDDPVDYGRR